MKNGAPGRDGCVLADFSYDTYRRMLDAIRSDRFNVCLGDFPLTPAPDRFFILRHDVDMSPEAALRLAELNAREGVRATFFLLFSSPYYNLLSAEYCTFPRRLTELGHEVGLHYDPAVYARCGGTGGLPGVLRAHANVLGELAGRPVRSIAMHHPSVGGPDPFAGRAGFVNAYDPAFVKDIAYYSDSCGAWRDATYRAFESGELPARLQILIHPIYWDETSADRRERLDAVVRRRKAVLDSEAANYWVVFRSHQGLLEHEARQRARQAGRRVPHRSEQS